MGIGDLQPTMWMTWTDSHTWEWRYIQNYFTHHSNARDSSSNCDFVPYFNEYQDDNYTGCPPFERVALDNFTTLIFQMATVVTGNRTDVRSQT